MSEIENILKIEGLTKRFGRITVVDNLELTIPKGSVFGLLGPNGSGKSTTLGMVLGVVNPSGGTFSWFGEMGNYKVRKRLGAIIESPSFYHYLSAKQNLRVVCEIKNVAPSRIDVVLEKVQLLDRKNDSFKTYSLGMKQRLAIASALLSDPEVLILDEPTNGLDPQGIAEIRNLIIDLANEGRTIIIASHLLDEVQRICTDFAVLRSGKKIYQGKVNEFSGELRNIQLHSEDEPGLLTFLESSSMISSFRREGDRFSVFLNKDVAITEFHKALIENGIVLDMLSVNRNSLEEKFLEILKSASND